MDRTDLPSPADDFASAAENLIGTPFRLHGRDPASGLDCVGLVYASLVAIGIRPAAPQGYNLRNRSIEHWLVFASLSSLVRARGPVRRGDVLLLQPSAVQHHLMIAASKSQAIHAHAGLRKVVKQPLGSDDLFLAKWRIDCFRQG
ncbi:MAG: NlpC/P60 family protein [Erythrobacter sp.]